MTPDPPAPEPKPGPKEQPAGAKPAETPAQQQQSPPQQPQSRPARPLPTRPAAPGSPPQEAAPIHRQDPLIAMRLGILIAATVITFLALSFLGFFGSTFAKFLVEHSGWVNYKVKKSPTPAAPALPSAYSNPKTVPTIPPNLQFIPQDTPPPIKPTATPKPEMKTPTPGLGGQGRGGAGSPTRSPGPRASGE